MCYILKKYKNSPQVARMGPLPASVLWSQQRNLGQPAMEQPENLRQHVGYHQHNIYIYSIICV